jgi:hypothetical protein
MWTWLGGYEAPPVFAVYGGVALIFALAVHSYLALVEDAEASAAAGLEVEIKKEELITCTVEGEVGAEYEQVELGVGEA